MIDKKLILFLIPQNLIFYIELVGHEEGKPKYQVKRGWYLRSYARKYGKDGHIVNMITASDEIDCCVIRHVPNNRTFMDESTAEAYIQKLKRGEAEYERY